jgi:dihydrofolate reductase
LAVFGCQEVVKMRKVTFGGAISLDNYLARPNDAVDWLMWSDEAAAVMTAYWKTIDTILMGRKTYEFALRSGHGGGTPRMTTYVFSQTLPPDPKGIVTIISADVVEFVRDLKGRPARTFA